MLIDPPHTIRPEVSIPLRKFRKCLRHFKQCPLLSVSIPLRKFRKAELTGQHSKTEYAVSIPLRKFRKELEELAMRRWWGFPSL